MNFLKNNKKLIAGFAAGAIIFSGIGYAANEYLAGNIRYTKSGASTSITVAEALNELYDMKKNQEGPLRYWKKDTIVFPTNSNNYSYVCGYKPRSWLVEFDIDDITYTFISRDSVKTYLWTNNGRIGDDNSYFFSVTNNGINFTNWSDSCKGVSVDVYTIK